MRRFLLWTLPLTAALVAAGLFGWGFVSYLRGETGEPVDFLPAPARAAAPARAVLQPLTIGDSLARGEGDQAGLGIAGRLDDELRQRRLPARRTTNLGVSGARTADLLRQLGSANVRRLLAESNVIVISIGANDLWGGSDWRTAAPENPDAVMEAVLERIAEAVKIVRAASPRGRIFFIGLYNPFAAAPMGGQLTRYVNLWNARLLERFGADPNFTLVATEDLFAHRDRLALDRFHPNGEAYGLIARRIAEAL